MNRLTTMLVRGLGFAASAPALAQNPPPAANLFQTVAGKWGAVDSDTHGCATNPHTLAFTNNNKTMTFTSAKPFKTSTGVVTNVFVYDVLYAEANRITAYMQGETRRTDAGDRLVWALILTDPNTYHWRRTDRAETSRTTSNVRRR